MVGASLALAISRICTGVVMRAPIAPMTTIVISAGTVLWTVNQKRTSAAESRARPP